MNWKISTSIKIGVRTLYLEIRNPPHRGSKFFVYRKEKYYEDSITVSGKTVEKNEFWAGVKVNVWPLFSVWASKTKEKA